MYQLKVRSRDNMRTHLVKTEKEIFDEVKEIKVETAYYRNYIRNMVGDYIKNGMDSELVKYFQYIEADLNKFIDHVTEILIDTTRDDATWDLMMESVHDLILEWLEEDAKIEFLLEASTIEDDSVFKEYANFLYDQEKDMIAKCRSVAEMEVLFFLRGVE